MPIVAGYDPNPSDNLRVEVAFETAPDDPSPVWVDLTDRLDLSAGVTISRGRQDEFSVIQPSTMNLTLDNSDGELTAGNSGSAFYPNVLPHRKIRVSYRNPDAGGNFVDEESASLEGGTTGSWVNTVGGSPPVTIAASATRSTSGSRSLLITWPTAGANTVGAGLNVSGLVIGRAYTLSADVYRATGHPRVTLGIFFGASVTSTVVDAFGRLSVAFTATANTHTIVAGNADAATAGQQAWVDSIRVDEGTDTAFTADAPPIDYRFTGYVEEWPCEWPNGGAYSQAQITAVDRLARIGAKRPMRSVIEEAILDLSPGAYYPMGEPELSTKAGDASGTPRTTPLSVTQIGAAGTLEFGTATGPPTDALPAPTFTPVSSTNGKYLTGEINPIGGSESVSLRANFLTSTVVEATVVRIRDPYNSHLSLQVSAAGKLNARMWDAFSGVDIFTLTSAAGVTDGATHDAAVTLSQAGGTITATLYLDGANVASTSFASPFLVVFTAIRVGGNTDGSLFTGTISHVAALNSALTPAQVLEAYTATITGFEGDTSDERIARYASWAGIADAELDLDAGSSTSVCFTDTTGQSVLQAMQDVAQTEGGRLFINGAGLLVFHSRSRTYDNPAAAASVDATLLGEDVRFSMSTQGLVNDMIGKRPTGPEVRAFDADSIETYGVSAQSVTLLVTSDTEVADAVNWRVQGNKDPQVRLPSARFDLYTETSGYQAQLRGLELGDRITVTGLPAQAPASEVDLVVEGYSETIGLTGWDLTANLSNFSTVQALVLDDDVYGLLDGDNRLIY